MLSLSLLSVLEPLPKKKKCCSLCRRALSVESPFPSQRENTRLRGRPFPSFARQLCIFPLHARAPVPSHWEGAPNPHHVPPLLLLLLHIRTHSHDTLTHLHRSPPSSSPSPSTPRQGRAPHTRIARATAPVARSTSTTVCAASSRWCAIDRCPLCPFVRSTNRAYCAASTRRPTRPRARRRRCAPHACSRSAPSRHRPNSSGGTFIQVPTLANRRGRRATDSDCMMQVGRNTREAVSVRVRQVPPPAWIRTHPTTTQERRQVYLHPPRRTHVSLTHLHKSP